MCYADSSERGYRIGCVEQCPGDCTTNRKIYDVCANDLVTYESECEMKRLACELYKDMEDDPGFKNFTEIKQMHSGQCGKNNFISILCSPPFFTMRKDNCVMIIYINLIKCPEGKVFHLI